MEIEGGLDTPLFKSKKEKEQEAANERMKSFQIESWSILNECIEELKTASFAPKEQLATAEDEALVEVPVPEMAVVMRPSGDVISIVEITDVASPSDPHEAVVAIQSMIDGEITQKDQVVPAEFSSATALVHQLDDLFVSIVWKGRITNEQYESTSIAANNVVTFLEGTVPKRWSEKDYSTLYYSFKYTFGRDVEPMEGLADRAAKVIEEMAPVSDVVSEPLSQEEFYEEVSFMLEDMKDRGYSTGRLHEIKSMKYKDAKRAYARYKSDLKLTNILEARFYRIDTSKYPDEATDIMRKLRNMEDLMVAADEIQALDIKVTGQEIEDRLAGKMGDGFELAIEDDPKFKQSMTLIKKLEEEGWETAQLYRFLYSGDVALFSTALQRYKQGMDRLEKLEGRIIQIYAEGFERQFEHIRKKLKDPSQAATAENEVRKLQKLVKDESERERIFKSLNSALEGWSKQGFHVEDLKEVLTKDPHTILMTFKRFGERVREAVELEEELNTMDYMGFEEEVSEIRRKLMDPERVREARDDLTSLKYWIRNRDDADSIKQRLNTKLARWWEEGYDVSNLKKQMEEDMPIEVVQDIFGDYEAFIKMLKDAEDELDHLFLEGFEKEEEEIRNLLKDIANLPLIKERMDELKEKVLAKMQEDAAAVAGPDGDASAPVKNVAKLADAIIKVSHRLPVSLWGKEPKDLAEELVEAKYGTTKGGELIVRLGRRWYHGDPRSMDKFLTNYNITIRGKTITVGKDL